MPDYRRYRIPGGCYFFTVNLLERHPNDLLVRHVDLLRETVREVRQRRPFHIDGWVVLPDHLHCIWTLPVGDADFTTRWRLIKAGFAKRLPITERRSDVRVNRGERGIWQRRFWEHAIRDEQDYANHMDYCTSIRSSMGMPGASRTGRIRVSNAVLSGDSIRVIGPVPASMRIGWRGKEGHGCVLFDATHSAQYAALLRPTRADLGR